MVRISPSSSITTPWPVRSMPGHPQCRRCRHLRLQRDDAVQGVFQIKIIGGRIRQQQVDPGAENCDIWQSDSCLFEGRRYHYSVTLVTDEALLVNILQ